MAGAAANMFTSERETGNGGEPGGSRDDSFLEDRFVGLNLHGEEEEDLDLSEEIEGLIEETRWIAIFRVHTLRPFSHTALFKSLRNGWAPAQGVIFKAKGDNLFLAQFMCLGDWNRVMNNGPWLFRNSAVVLEEYDGITNVHEYKLDRIPVWARIIELPDGLMKKKEIAEKIAAKVGTPPFTVIVNEGRINPRKYLRARVFVKLDTPLVRFVPLTLKESKRYPVEYEKLPWFCYFCGRIGHTVMECGDGIHEEDECEWGEWLLVNYDSQINRKNGGDAGPAGGRTSRGGGPEGRSGYDGRSNDEENTDMAVDGRLENNSGAMVPLARKRLIGQDGFAVLRNKDAINPCPGFVTDTVNLIEGKSAVVVDKSQLSTPQKIHDPKRQRADPRGSDDVHAIQSATSFEEDRRAQ